MERLGQIQLENTISVQMSCIVDQKIIAKNFGIIMDCLKGLSDKQSSFDKQLKDLNSLRQQMKDLNQKFDRNVANNGNNVKNIDKNDLGNRGSNNNQKSITGDERNKNIEANKNKSDSNEIKKEENINQKLNQKNNSHENNLKSNEKQIIGTDFDRLSTDLHGLKERVTKNQGNINDNIKDINVIFKDIKQIKELLNSLGKTEITNKKQKSDINQKSGPNFDINSIKEIHNQIIKKQEYIDKIMEDMEKMMERIEKNEKDISELKLLKDTKNNSNNGGNNNANNNINNNNNSDQIQNMNNQINDLKDKLNILSQKLSNNILDTNQNSGEIKNLNTENSKRKSQTESNKKEIQNLKNQLNRLIQDLDDSNNKRQAEMRNMKNDVNKMKKNQKSSGDHSDKKIHSNTSIDEESNNKLGIEKSPYTQKKFYSSHNSNYADAIRQLQDRVKYLQKMISGSKQLIQEDKNNNPEKLPMIRRPIITQKQKEKDSTNKTHFSTSKRDIGELKAEIQAWVKNYFQSGKEKGDFGNIELQLQQIRNMLNKKADYQGMKKGLTFLENKINQLYLFLTEPDTEDAMIVRKGFNCLSCSKGVQKLRGRLGPNINWNNMTTTNYSPPRVGYSKPMGEGSIDRDD